MPKKKASQVVNDCSGGATTLLPWGQVAKSLMVMIMVVLTLDGVDYDHHF